MEDENKQAEQSEDGTDSQDQAEEATEAEETVSNDVLEGEYDHKGVAGDYRFGIAVLPDGVHLTVTNMSGQDEIKNMVFASLGTLQRFAGELAVHAIEIQNANKEV